jgi:hypothetical protein
LILLSKYPCSMRVCRRILKFNFPGIWKFCAGFVFWSKADGRRRELNAAQFIKIRIQRLQAIHESQALDAFRVACGIASCKTPSILFATFNEVRSLSLRSDASFRSWGDLLHFVSRRCCSVSILLIELLLRQQVCMSFAGRSQRSHHRFLGIAALGLCGLMSGERTTLAVRQFGFLKLGHAAVSTSIKREQL